jgi:hypothetical protein
LASGPAFSQADSSPACENNAALDDLQTRLKACEARVAELEERLRGSQTKSSGLIPHVLIGPDLSLLSLPSPGIGIEARLWQIVGLSIAYGFIPQVGISDVEVKYRMWQGTVKLYPFRGTFFIGAIAGAYKFTASETTGGQRVETNISSTILGPQLGWRWIFSSGFFTGLDLAYGFALKYDSTLTPPIGSGTIADIKKNADDVLQHGLPVLGLLHLGWFF